MPRSTRAPRSELRLAAAVLAIGAALFLAWRAANGLFLIFAGLLLAVFLDGCARALGRIWDASRTWRLAVSTAALVLLSGAGLAAGGYTMVRQADDLAHTVQSQLQLLRGELSERGLLRQPDAPRAKAEPDGRGTAEPLVRSFLPDPGAVARSVASAFGVFFGGIGNAIVVLFLGLYVAADPRTYRRASLLAFPRDLRNRARAVIDEIVETLRAWILGQLVSMGVVGGMSYLGLALIGMPGALVLSVQIALFAFIPYIGAFIGGSVIVLAAFAQGTVLALSALGVYLVVQMVETYAVTPLVQRRAVGVPPAFAIAGVVVFGTLFGFWGLVLAAPLMAALRIVLLQLWVEGGADEPVQRAIARG